MNQTHQTNLWQQFRDAQQHLFTEPFLQAKVDTYVGVTIFMVATRQADWSQQTFGSDKERGPIGPLKHLIKEADEAQSAWGAWQALEASLDDDLASVAKLGLLEELADCSLLLFDALRRAGFTTVDLVSMMWKKQILNEKREWNVKVDNESPVEHVKDVKDVKEDESRIAGNDTFNLHMHTIRRGELVGGAERILFTAWPSVEDVARPLCYAVVHQTELMGNYLEWIHVEEGYRRTGIATAVATLIEAAIGPLELSGVTEEGEAWCEAFCEAKPDEG